MFRIFFSIGVLAANLLLAVNFNLANAAVAPAADQNEDDGVWVPLPS